MHSSPRAAPGKLRFLAADSTINGNVALDVARHVSGDVALRVPSTGNDVLTGISQTNWLSARAGYDGLIGLGGANEPRGAAGDDWVIGGAGCDRLEGGSGRTCST